MKSLIEKIMARLQIGVIGYNQDKSNEITNKIAYEVGTEIAKTGAILICGGLGGVMEYACKGAKEHGGLTVGIIPQEEVHFANKFCDVVIATGIGYARDFVVATSADGIIAVGGGVGTLIELCVGYMLKKILVTIPTSGGTARIFGGRYLDDRKRVFIKTSENAHSAVKLISDYFELKQ
ncbi:MAG TPA: TIGR00725 family protein [Nitrososphaeraceae archaeon]|nr:TIGR00725 family protein [Nitrososphaeraceae archaeon]